MPVICAEQGLLAVCGLGVDRRGAVTDRTRRIIEIEINSTEDSYD
jgi:hypothetical protein